MTVIARRICATPARSASEAWATIINLLAPSGASAARLELDAIAGIAANLIADEAMAAPVIVYGFGPRVRLYCLYGDEAISGEQANETPLAFDVTSGDWRMSLPCPTADLAWARAALAGRADRISARDMTEPVDTEAANESVTVISKRAAQPNVVVDVDRERFFHS